MNDSELDEMLNTWSAPGPSASLRAGIRARFPRVEAGPKRRGWTVPWSALLAGAAAAAAGIFVVTSVALPQVRGVPYTVDSEFLVYAADGTPAVVMNEISYSHNGREEMLSRWLPDALQTALARTADMTGLLMAHFHQVARHFAGGEGGPIPQARVIGGCVDSHCHLIETYAIGSPAELQSTGCVADNKLVGAATVLGYGTKIVQRAVRGDVDRRATLWLAPGLSCFALKIVTEEKAAGGNYRVTSERRAVKVTVNP